MTRSRVHAHSPVISRAEFYDYSLSFSVNLLSLHPVLSPPFPFSTCDDVDVHFSNSYYLSPSRVRRKLNSPTTWNLASPRRRYSCSYSSSNITWVTVASVHRHCPHRKDGWFIGRSDRLLVRLIAITLERRDSLCSFFHRARENVLHKKGSQTELITSLSSHYDFYI